jgi:hypothetical protein
VLADKVYQGINVDLSPKPDLAENIVFLVPTIWRMIRRMDYPTASAAL